MMIDHIDDILFILRNSDSKNPMSADVLAEKLEMTPNRFEEVMDIICNIVPAPVNRAYKEVTQNIQLKRKAFKGYVYWPTGVVDKAHWKDFKPASSKPAGQPVRTELSTKKVSADIYETPVFGQPLITPVPDYSGKPKAYQILKAIEANPGATTKQLSDSVGTADIGNYVKAYLERGLVVRGKNEDGKSTWSLKDGWSADQVYETRKGGSNHIQQPGAAKNEATSNPKPSPETNDDRAGMSQVLAASVEKADAVEQVQEARVQLNQAEVGNDHPAAKVRFAITSDKHIILMGLTAEDIELTEHDSHVLIQFCGDIALAANASDALATRMVDLETLGS
jgi:hypothetical protein